MMLLFNRVISIIIFCLLVTASIYVNSAYAKDLISNLCEPLIVNASPAEDVKHSQGLLWKISKNNNKTSYLFGTIHVSDPAITTLPEIVDKALHDSKRFAMEALPDAEQMMEFSKAMFFHDGQLLSTFVDEPIYEKTKQILAQYSLSPDAVSVMKPWAAFLLMNYPPDQGEPLDLVLLSLAQQNGAAVSGLESLSEQGEIFSQLKMDEQVKLLIDTVCHYEVVEQDFAVMKSFYLKRDLAGLYNYAQRYSMSDEAVYKNLMKKLIQDRNYKMTDRIQPMLEKGKSFIAIGAMHLTGKEGVLALLEKQGYKVTAIY